MRTPILRRFAAGVHIAALAVLAFAFHKVLVGLLLFCEYAGWSESTFHAKPLFRTRLRAGRLLGHQDGESLVSSHSRTTHGLCVLKALNNYVPRTAPRIQ